MHGNAGCMRSLPRRALVVLFLLGLGGALVGERPARADNPPAAKSAERASLQQAVDELDGWVKQHHGRLGAAVMDVDQGTLLAASGEHQALSPASNSKLLTAAAALTRLGPAYRYTTGLYGRLSNGAVGDLVLRGHGDPSLDTDNLWGMCRSLVAMGLTRVRGSILVDQSRFDSQFVPPAFGQQPNEWASFRAPVSAVALDENAEILNVMPTSAGHPARAWFDPPGFVGVSGSVQTVDTGKGQDIRLTLHPGEHQRLDAVLGGRIAEGLPRLRFARRVDDPRLYPGYVLADILQRLGVKLSGRVAEGGESEHSRLVFHESKPLAVLMQHMCKDSDNFYAEMILKTLGAETAGAPAHSSDGAKAVRHYLRKIGALESTTKIINGSGLFDANRVSTFTLVHVLVAAYRDPAIRPEYVAELPVGGVDGTLHSRFRQYRSERMVRAKTGTLARSIALSGYVLGPRGRDAVAFSFIANGGMPHNATRHRLDLVVDRIVDELYKR